MQMRLFSRFVSLVMAIIMPSALSMGEVNAMLYPTGGVTVNGAAAPGSSAIFAGDKVQTLTQATAMISDGTSTIRLREDSSLIYKANNVQLDRGSALVVTKKGTTGQFGGISVSPVSSDSTKFALMNQPGNQTIAAIEGALRITDGNHTFVLQPGQALTHGPTAAALQDSSSQVGTANGQDTSASSQGQTSASNDSDKKKKKKRREEPAAAATGERFGIPNWKLVALVTGAAIAPIGGLLIYDEVTEPASPSKP